MNTWTRQLFYVLRNAQGVIVGLSETQPSEYSPTTTEARDKAYRATNDVEKQITEYAKRKRNEKRLWMGGD